MTAAENAADAYSIGWLASLSLHTGLIFGALLVTEHLTLAPETALFKWNVAIVSAPLNPVQSSAAPATTVQPSRTRSTSQALMPNASAAITSVLNSPGEATLDPLPPSDEPIVQKTDISSTLQGSRLERTEHQPEELESSSGETAATTATLSSRQFESVSESVLMSSSIQTSLPPQEAIAPPQTSNTASLATSDPRHDYAWLSETIMRRMQELKKYPAEARLDRAEGKVVLKAVIRSDGGLGSVEVFQSSGHQTLDRAAVELLNLAAPFHFPRPLEKPQMTVKIPMNYRLEP